MITVQQEEIENLGKMRMLGPMLATENELDREDSNRQQAHLRRPRNGSDERTNGSVCHSRFQLAARLQSHIYKSMALLGS
jgi:hypothetical protein